MRQPALWVVEVRTDSDGRWRVDPWQLDVRGHFFRSRADAQDRARECRRFGLPGVKYRVVKYVRSEK